jgi:alpha-L-fucosidase
MAGAAFAAGMSANAAAAGPTKAQAEWMKLGYGMFLHFGPNTLARVGWGDGKFPASSFQFPKLDCAQWAGVAAEAGMKYAVLTTKHLDGFCLWPSKHTKYCVKSSPTGDVVKMFVDAFRREGMKIGFYYSLWDKNQPLYENDAAYAEYMRKQVEELLTQYGDVIELWFDGSWDKDHPTKEWPYDPKWENDPKSGLGYGERYEWKALYEHIHKLQPDCLVINNSSSDRPGGVRYMPVDVRTAEHFHFVYKEQLYEPPTDPVYTAKDGTKMFLPVEYCTSLNPGWFWTGKEYSHPSAEAIAGWRKQARAAGGNFLLNIGPNQDGLIPEYHRGFLRDAKMMFR